MKSTGAKIYKSTSI